MAVKEFICFAHGPFEAKEAKCPRGCTVAVEREFRTAPATRSAKTKATDQALERLARSYGLTDISNRNGSVAESRKIGGIDFTPQWLPVAKGDNLEIGKGIVSREGASGGANVTAQQYHTQRIGDEPLATEQVPLPLGKLPPRPKPNIVGKDTVTSAQFTDALSGAT